MANYSGVIQVSTTWTKLKATVSSKNLALQYDSGSNAYEIFALDGSILYSTVIFTGSVPNTVDFNQAQNDLDKTDFETNFKDITTNRATSASAAVDGYAVATTSPTLIAASDGTTIRTLKSDSSGRLITVGLGTAGSPSGGVLSIQGVSGGQAIPISGTVTASNASTSATGAAPPAQATYIGGSVTTAAPTYTTGQMNALSLTTSGALRIDGSATTQPVSGTVTANIGTTNGLALDTTLAKLTIAQSAALGSNTQALMGGSVTTAAPTYTTGNINPLSLTTAGALRIDGSGTTQPVSGTVTATQATAANLRSQTASESTTATATGTVASLTGGAVTTAAPTYTTGQMNPLSLTTSGALRIDGSATTQPISGTVTANAGTGNFTVVQATAANLRSQTASESTTAAATGTVASLTGGAVTTAAPTYTTGQMNPLSLTTSGALRTDSSGSTQPVSGTVAVTQATASNLNAQVQGTATSGAAASGNPVLTGGSDGSNARTFKTLTDGTQLVKSREIATFTALATATAPANNKSMFSLQNTTGSAVKVKIHEIYLVNVQTAAATGVVITFEMRRATSHTSGTAITAIETMDSTDSLSASVTVRSNATITGESATLLWKNVWSSDDWSTGTNDVESADHDFQTMFPIYSRKTTDSKPITLNANESLTIKCATNTTVGTFDLMVVFTQE
jgi:hypothetical protein